MPNKHILSDLFPAALHTNRKCGRDERPEMAQSSQLNLAIFLWDWPYKACNW